MEETQNQIGSSLNNYTALDMGPVASISPNQLGILEEDDFPIEDKYPFVQEAEF